MIPIRQHHIDILEGQINQIHDLLEEARAYRPATLGLGRLVDLERKTRELEMALERLRGLRRAQCN